MTPAPEVAPARLAHARPTPWRLYTGVAAALGVIALLALVSVGVGASDIGLGAILTGDLTESQALALTTARIPRTIALVLAGAAMAVAGLLMQLLVRNRFVEPSTVGTTESAGLGILLATILAPGSPLVVKMLVATAFALAGTYLFLRVLRHVPTHTVVMVPLVGMILAGIIAALSTFIAWEANLLPTLQAWMTGDFSGVMAGRYELLWVVALCGVVAYLLANSFTVAGLGETMATSLGINHRQIVAIGLSLVAVVSAVTVVVVGALPFLGLVVPNVVTIFLGDFLRRSLPWVALGGAGLVLVCDIVGRVLIAPAEIPIGTAVGTLGAGIFLALLLRRAPGER